MRILIINSTHFLFKDRKKCIGRGNQLHLFYFIFHKIFRFMSQTVCSKLCVETKSMFLNNGKKIRNETSLPCSIHRFQAKRVKLIMSLWHKRYKLRLNLDSIQNFSFGIQKKMTMKNHQHQLISRKKIYGRACLCLINIQQDRSNSV